MAAAVSIRVRLLQRTGDHPNHWVQESFEEGLYCYIVNGYKQTEFPIESIFPSTKQLLGNNQQLWFLLNAWLQKEVLGMDDFMGGFCFDIGGISWGYYRDELTIGSSFDYMSYMSSWLNCFPEESTQLIKDSISIYGNKFEFQQLGNYLQIHFKGKGVFDKEKFLKFYPVYMYYPVQLNFYEFTQELWNAYKDYLRLLEKIKDLLQQDFFPAIADAKFKRNRIVILSYLKDFS